MIDRELRRVERVAVELEDGAIVDQIVLSPSTYLTTAPGARRDDTTIILP